MRMVFGIVGYCEKLRMKMVHGYACDAVCGSRGPHNAKGTIFSWREIMFLKKMPFSIIHA